MSQIKTGGLDQYGAEPFEQQQFGRAGVEGVKKREDGKKSGLLSGLVNGSPPVRSSACKVPVRAWGVGRNRPKAELLFSFITIGISGKKETTRKPSSNQNHQRCQMRSYTVSQKTTLM